MADEEGAKQSSGSLSIPATRSPERRSVFDGFRRHQPPLATEESPVEAVQSPTQRERSTGVGHTVEVPMTEAVRAVLLADRKSNSMVRTAGIILPVIIGIPLVVYLIALNTVSGERRDQYMFEAMALPVFLAIILGAYSVFYTVWQHIRAKADYDLNLAEGVYLRTSGRGTLSRRTHRNYKPDTYHIKVIPRAKKPHTGLQPRPVRSGQSNAHKDKAIEFVIKQASGLDPALWEKAVERRSLLFDNGSGEIQLAPHPITAEYTKYGHLVLAVRDARGRLLYRHLEYHVD